MNKEELIKEFQKTARDSVPILRRLLLASLLKTIIYCLLSIILFSVGAGIIYQVNLRTSELITFSGFLKLVGVMILYLLVGICCGVGLSILSNYQNLVSKLLKQCLQPLYFSIMEHVFNQKETMNIYFFQQGLNNLVTELSKVLEESLTKIEKTLRNKVKIFTLFANLGVKVFKVQTFILIYINELMVQLTRDKLLNPVKKEGKTDINIVEVGEFFSDKLDKLIEQAAANKVKFYRRFIYVLAGCFLFAPIAITLVN